MGDPEKDMVAEAGGKPLRLELASGADGKVIVKRKMVASQDSMHELSAQRPTAELGGEAFVVELDNTQVGSPRAARAAENQSANELFLPASTYSPPTPTRAPGQAQAQAQPTEATSVPVPQDSADTPS
jgi:hypothetical protein